MKNTHAEPPSFSRFWLSLLLAVATSRDDYEPSFGWWLMIVADLFR
jgi:hypothetical protein